MPTSTAGTARERLLGAAARLFYARGIAATGIDAITSEAGVARKSLYNNFSSKDQLTLAYLEERHREWLDLYEARAASADGPRERVLAVVDAYLDHADGHDEQGFRGCGLLNAAAELPAGSSGREAVRRHKEQVEQILRDHLQGLGADDPDGLAEHLALLLEGATTRAGLDGAPDRIRRARALVETLLERA